MSSVKEMKRKYLLTLTKTGRKSADDSFVFLPESTRERWTAKFLTPQRYVPSYQRRYLNHFMLGADPEFVFTTLDGDPADATAYGLKTGLAFGADQNGRLIEMRPAPSRSALEVTASVLSELRWLARLHPEARRNRWQAGAYMHGDGLGGHIHFGRKRPTAPNPKRKHSPELQALDAIGKTLWNVEVFPNVQWARRLKPDDHGNRGYGHYGDYRPQVHGYEYRTLPSWLDSPWLAYLCFVLSKLAVHDPEFVNGLEQKNQESIKHLLAYFKGRDDDALLAFTTLQRVGLPPHNGNDFKSRWGLTYAGLKPDVTIVPGTITPCPEDIQDLTEHFVSGTAIPARETLPTWTPVNLPLGFVSIIRETDITRRKGLGETIGGMCYHRDIPIRVGVQDAGGVQMIVSQNLMRLFPKDWKRRVKRITNMNIRAGGGTGSIQLSQGAREVTHMQQTKQVLLSGLFPIWRYKDANEESFKKFMGNCTTKDRGTVLSNQGL